MAGHELIGECWLVGGSWSLREKHLVGLDPEPMTEIPRRLDLALASPTDSFSASGNRTVMGVQRTKQRPAKLPPVSSHFPKAEVGAASLRHFDAPSPSSRPLEDLVSFSLAIPPASLPIAHFRPPAPELDAVLLLVLSLEKSSDQTRSPSLTRTSSSLVTRL